MQKAHEDGAFVQALRDVNQRCAQEQQWGVEEQQWIAVRMKMQKACEEGVLASSLRGAQQKHDQVRKDARDLVAEEGQALLHQLQQHMEGALAQALSAQASCGQVSA